MSNKGPYSVAELKTLANGSQAGANTCSWKKTSVNLKTDGRLST
ncbi:hypothetical protein [Syntrophomonas palmitatica]|nr:hypothetical protein [Syntrophomonas palmitatica]